MLEHAMAWTVADRDALMAAMARGEKRVAFADRSVEYRSLDEMRAALKLIEDSLVAVEDRPTVYRVIAGKGL